jgi:calcium-translocating P-type ATPase
MTHAWSANGDCTPFYRYRWEERLQAMTGGGRRVLLIATGSVDRYRGPTDLTLLCAVTLRDRIRREARPAVETLHRAGIHVVMITGDHRETAQAIARECGILNDRVTLSLTGEELNRMSDLKIRELLPQIGVIARALPTDKSRLVRIAQEADLVVGMTGDGINDAPALRRADIGFAMGNGTQVAKEAGDIIILDNNLSSIVRAVLYGRNIFKSIRKFIVLQLTMNLCAVGVSMICPFMGIDAPVTVVQMLWINMIMDTLGGLAFAGEPPLPSCMEEPPKRRDEPILNFYMLHQIFLLGSFTVGLCLLFLNLPAITVHFRETPDHIYLLTAFFALFIFAGVFNCFNARTDRLNLLAGISGNVVFLLIMAIITVIQVIFVYLGGAVLRTAPLTLEELGVTVLLALAVIPAEFLRKLLWRVFHGKNGY